MKHEQPTLIIRTDANSQTGSGHLMRCLALAQAWQDAGGRVLFVMAMVAPAIEARLLSEGMETVYLPVQPGGADDAIQTAEFARKMGAPWVVVDGYHFGTVYQRIIKDTGLRLLLIDDNGHAEHYYADIILNQNLHAHGNLYKSREPYTSLLLGTRYVLLRREFLQWRGWQPEIPEVACKVLVTLGGADPDNMTLRGIQTLQRIDMDGLEAVTVVGGSNPHYKELRSAADESRQSMRVVTNVTNMPELMAWADVAISAGGTTVWELAFMGVPGIIGRTAPNQEALAEELSRRGVFIDMGWFANLSVDRLAAALEKLLRDREMRAEMSGRGRQVLDGRGCDRVLESMF